MKQLVIFMALFMGLVGPTFAANPGERLTDPKLEERARMLSAGLRCLVCQSQSIDDSDADIARDLRLLVRDRLSQGDSDEQVLQYLVSRYGQFVLLKPRLSGETLLLWGTPFLLPFAAGLWLWGASRRAAFGRVESLTAHEESRLREIMTEASADAAPDDARRPSDRRPSTAFGVGDLHDA
ncbi:cytochrome c-type biogenesis protein CcmH [Mesorhizobium sp. B2-3-5]|nr:cytochrome c-type biogenesis protein CcmH [Mesorhizobium sp. B2-3-5]